jgi:hypothetical protein
MNIYEGIVMTTFIMVTITMISQYIDANTTKVSDVLQLMNVLPCYEVKAYRGGRRLKTSELIQHINSPVKAHDLKEGVLYIEIY